MTTTVALLCRWWFDNRWLNTFHSFNATGDSSGRTREACVDNNTDRGTLLSEELDTARWLVLLRVESTTMSHAIISPSVTCLAKVWVQRPTSDGQKTSSLISSSCLLYSRGWFLFVYLTSWYFNYIVCRSYLLLLSLSVLSWYPEKYQQPIPFFQKIEIILRAQKFWELRNNHSETSNCHFYHSAFVQTKQTRYNMLISEF